jgi:ABC-type transport system involved in multi-copper enzyme maturation permease subunit
MTVYLERAGSSLRIILAIAAKDIVDAMKNRTIFTVMMGLAFMMLSSQALPLLLKLRPVPKAAAFDPGKSILVEAVAQLDSLQIRRIRTPGATEAWIAEASELELGLLIPEDIDQLAANGDRIELEGLAVHWADPVQLLNTVTFFEERFSEVAGTDVTIRMKDKDVFPRPDAGGRPFMVSMTFVVAVVMVGIFMVPYLMIEEKESHTMDTLLVSPARYGEVVLGKALAGTFYCAAAVAVIFLFHFHLVNLWGIAIIALLCGALFAVSVGLLMGILFENPASMNLWLGLLMLILLVPVFLSDVAGSNFNQIVTTIVPWIPSVSLSKALKLSFSDTASLNTLLPNLVTLLGGAVLFLSLVVWRVRRFDN